MINSEELRRLQNKALYNQLSEEDLLLLLEDCNFISISSQTLSFIKSDWIYPSQTEYEQKIILENLVLKLYRKTYIDPTNKKRTSALFKLFLLHPSLIEVFLLKNKNKLFEKIDLFDELLNTESILYLTCLAISLYKTLSANDKRMEYFIKIIEAGNRDLLFDCNSFSKESPIGLLQYRFNSFSDFERLSPYLVQYYPEFAELIKSSYCLSNFVEKIKRMKLSDFIIQQVD